MLKETQDKFYFTNSYGQTVSVKKETLKDFALKERLVDHVFPEVAETIDRLFRKQSCEAYRIVSPMEVSLELGVGIKTVGQAMDKLEEMGILMRQPTKALQVGSDKVSEPTGDDCIYSILKQYKPKVGI